MVARQVLTLKIEVRALAGEYLLSKKIRSVVSAVLLTALITSCALPPKVQPSNPSAIDLSGLSRAELDKGTQRSSEMMHQYLMGEMSLQDEKLPEALLHFKNASASMNDPLPDLRMKIAELSLKTGNLEKALEETKAILEKTPENPDALLMYGGVLEALSRYDEAEPVYRKVISLTPKSINPYLVLASLYLRRNATSDSVAVLRDLTKMIPDNPLGFYNLGRALEASGDLKGSEIELRRAFALVPDNRPLGLDLVRVLIKQGKKDEALKVCNEILERDPNNSFIRKVVGNILLGDSNYDEALKHLEVLEKEENDPTETRLKIALIHVERQNFKEAERELSLILAKTPEHGLARYYLGSVQASTARPKLAVDTLLSVPKDNEMFVPARLLSALILKQEKDPARAIDVIKKSLAVLPENLDLLAYYSSMLREQKKYDEAEKILLSMQEKLPNNDKLMFELAMTKFQLKKTEEAEALVKNVIQVNPANAEAYNFLAYSYAEKRLNLEEALTLINKALELQPNNGYFLDTKGWVLFQQENFSEAVATLALAVEKTGSDVEILYHYGMALVKAGDTKGAREIFIRVLDQLRLEGSEGKEHTLSPKAVENELQNLK